MSTFTQIYYHIVFSTKDRVPALSADRREDLFRYIWGILKNKDCHLYRIGGVVVLDAANAVEVAILVLQNPPDVPKEVFPPVRR